jgi:CHAD domain-containing protein
VGARTELTVLELVQRSIAAANDRLRAQDAALVEGDDPEAVHQARVATRRLRSDLRTFRDFLDEEWVAQLRGELRWWGGELGAVRDIEVLRDRLREHATALPRAQADTALHVIRRLDADRAAARAELGHALISARYSELVLALGSAMRTPRVVRDADAPAVEVLPSIVRRPWKKLRGSVAALGEQPADEALHEVRIRAKRCRYAAEAAAEAFGKPARRFADAMATIQDVLGAHQDTVVARKWLAKTMSECPAPAAYALGMLAEIERSEALDARAAFPHIWRRAHRKRLRRWL